MLTRIDLRGRRDVDPLSVLQAAVANVVAVQHVVAHGHGQRGGTGLHFDDLHAERLGRAVVAQHAHAHVIGGVLRGARAFIISHVVGRVVSHESAPT